MSSRKSLLLGKLSGLILVASPRSNGGVEGSISPSGTKTSGLFNSISSWMLLAALIIPKLAAIIVR